MPYRSAKAQLVHGPEPLGFVYGTEIKHLKPFFPDLLVDTTTRRRTNVRRARAFAVSHMLTFVIRQPSIR
jgi:hypothetical protein